MRAIWYLLLLRSAASLQFKADGTFKIVQLTDLHFGQDEMDDVQTLQVMHTVLDKEADADLVVFSGDMLSGWMGAGVHGWVADRYPRIVSVAVHHHIPYAMVLGNHDPQADFSRRQIVELDMQQPGSLTRAGPRGVAGASNYWLSIASSRDALREAMRVWLLDSEPAPHCGWHRKLGGRCCKHSLLSWLQQAGANASSVPALAYVHIPLPQFMDMWNAGGTHGLKHERVCCALQSACLFGVLRGAGVTAVYSGHDHSNSYYGTLHGVRLGYGRKTGYSSYGPPAGWLHGARVVLLREGQPPGESETWLRLEDGSRHDEEASSGRWWHSQHVCST